MSSIDDNTSMAPDLSYGRDETSSESLSPNTLPTGNTTENEWPSISMFNSLRLLAEKRYARTQKMSPGLGCSAWYVH